MRSVLDTIEKLIGKIDKVDDLEKVRIYTTIYTLTKNIEDH